MTTSIFLNEVTVVIVISVAIPVVIVNGTAQVGGVMRSFNFSRGNTAEEASGLSPSLSPPLQRSLCYSGESGGLCARSLSCLS